jgi:hypothetical protein
MVDTYADLSLKTLKMFSVLPAKFDADFYFKIDDDVAVNVDAMAAYLAAKRNQGNLYLVRAFLSRVSTLHSCNLCYLMFSRRVREVSCNPPVAAPRGRAQDLACVLLLLQGCMKSGQVLADA